MRIYTLNERIPLGYSGENRARTIAIDIAQMKKTWPTFVPVLLVRRPGETQVYACRTHIEDGIMYWEVTDADVAKAGEGELRIHMVDAEGRIAKSRITSTTVIGGMDGEMNKDPPEAIKPWIDEVLAAAQEIRAGYVPIDQGAENAGRLLYVRADGKLAPLTLGDGLVIENGVLRLYGAVTPETQIVFEDAGDGIVQMSGAAFSDQGSGVVLVSGAVFKDQGGGTVLIH